MRGRIGGGEPTHSIIVATARRVQSMADCSRLFARLSGVQIGGRKSPRGIVGIWTGADRETEDALTPCGPFSYWKIGTEEEDKAHVAEAMRVNALRQGQGLTWQEVLQGGDQSDGEEEEGDEDFELTSGSSMTTEAAWAGEEAEGAQTDMDTEPEPEA